MTERTKNILGGTILTLFVLLMLGGLATFITLDLREAAQIDDNAIAELERRGFESPVVTSRSRNEHFPYIISAGFGTCRGTIHFDPRTGVFTYVSPEGDEGNIPDITAAALEQAPSLAYCFESNKK